MNRYQGDPYWLTLRYQAKCAKCDADLKKGARAFRFKSGALYGEPCRCGVEASDRFQAEAADEAVYGGGAW